MICFREPVGEGAGRKHHVHDLANINQPTGRKQSSIPDVAQGWYYRRHRRDRRASAAVKLRLKRQRTRQFGRELGGTLDRHRYGEEKGGGHEIAGALVGCGRTKQGRRTTIAR